MSIPLDLYNTMGDPRWLIVSPELPSRLFLSKTDNPSLCSLRFFARHLARMLLKKDDEACSKVVSLLALNGENAMYMNIPPGYDNHYNIVNYHPYYYLMPVDSLVEETSRERFWATLQKYHEHLDPEDQDDISHRVSRWLAKDVMGKFQARSFLELGCGAGRNLLYIHREAPAARLYGIDINPDAVAKARAQVPGHQSDINAGSIYDTKQLSDESIDVVFTAGVLMHIPHDRIQGVVREMSRIARIAVVNLELHGPSHRFDYHRYPRDYATLYASIFPKSHVSYEIFPLGDYRTAGTASFNHALLILTK